MLIVSGSYQNHQNGAVNVSNQLTDSGFEKSVLRVNLLICRGKVVHSTLYTTEYTQSDNCHFLAHIIS